MVWKGLTLLKLIALQFPGTYELYTVGLGKVHIQVSHDKTFHVNKIMLSCSIKQIYFITLWVSFVIKWSVCTQQLFWNTNITFDQILTWLQIQHFCFNSFHFAHKDSNFAVKSSLYSSIWKSVLVFLIFILSLDTPLMYYWGVIFSTSNADRDSTKTKLNFQKWDMLFEITLTFHLNQKKT